MAGEKERRIKGVCRKCGISLQVNIGDASIDEVKDYLARRDGYECPGFHVELGSMLEGYDWDFTPFEAEPVMSDEDWVKHLQDQGMTVIDGGQKKVPGLKDIHSVPDLRHVGFGFFESKSHKYDRYDSPRGTRFYVEIPKRSADYGGDEI